MMRDTINPKTISVLLLFCAVRPCNGLHFSDRKPPADSPAEAKSFESATSLYESALAAFRRGQFQQASELLQLCLAKGDRRPQVYKTLALCAYLLNRRDKFEENIRAALELDPRDPESHYYLGRYFYERQNFNGALDSFGEATRLDANYYRAHYYKGLCYERLGEYRAAKQSYLAAIRIIEAQKLPYAWPFVDLGRRLISDGQFDSGLAWLQKATRNDPNSPYAHCEYARALLKSEDSHGRRPSPEVRDSLLKAISLDPGYTDAYYLLAQYYQKIGDVKRAAEAIAKFEELLRNPVPSPFGLRR